MTFITLLTAGRHRTAARCTGATSAASSDRSRRGGRAAPSARPCYPRVRATPRPCPVADRPGRFTAIDDDGEQVCAECAGIGASYLCARCGGPSDGYVRGRCAPCALRDRLDSLLTTGDGGAIHPAPGGVHAALSDWRNPRSVLTWLDRSDGAIMLADLAYNNGGISHDDLDRYPRSRASNYLGQALVHAGAAATSTSSRSKPGSKSSCASSRPRTASSCGRSPTGSSCDARDNDLANGPPRAPPPARDNASEPPPTCSATSTSRASSCATSTSAPLTGASPRDGRPATPSATSSSGRRYSDSPRD